MCVDGGRDARSWDDVGTSVYITAPVFNAGAGQMFDLP